MATDLIRVRAMKGTVLTNEEADTLVGVPTFEDSGHGLVVPNIVYRDSATSHALAQADAEATLFPGLAIVIYVSGDTYGVLRASSHGTLAITHGLGGSFGDPIYLSTSTPGGMTLTAPSTGLLVRLGYIIDSTHIGWEPGLFAQAAGD